MLAIDARRRATRWWRRRPRSRSTGCSPTCSAGATCRWRWAGTSRYDVDALIQAAERERARVVVLNSPNNPTGTALPDGAVERILDETDALVLCDEAYQDFGGPDGGARCCPIVAGGGAPHVLQGVRPGGASVRLRAGAPGAGARDRQGQAALQRERRHARGGRTRAGPRRAPGRADPRARRHAGPHRGAAPRAPGLTVFPTAANFVLLRCLRLRRKEVFRRLLDEYGILVRDLSGASELRSASGSRSAPRKTWTRWWPRWSRSCGDQ